MSLSLSIITITYNNLIGLKKTLKSLLEQNYHNWELIVVDGGSSDGTKEWLQATASQINKIGNESHVSQQESLTSNNMTNIGFDERFRYVSEPDKGIYDAQNKGIRMAKGEYCFFLNAGDMFCDKYVLDKMMLGEHSDVVYGNEIVVDAQGHQVEKCQGVDKPTFLDIYMSCMKHQATFIKRTLFERFGEYDISLRIVADWEWFFRVLAYNDDITLHYKNVDVSMFENNGASYNSPELCNKERQQVLDRYMSKRQQEDYVFCAKYSKTRYAERILLGSFLLKVVNWLGKRIRKRMCF